MSWMSSGIGRCVGREGGSQVGGSWITSWEESARKTRSVGCVTTPFLIQQARGYLSDSPKPPDATKSEHPEVPSPCMYTQLYLETG